MIRVCMRVRRVRGDKGGENSITLCSGLWRGLYTNTSFSCNRPGSSAVLPAGGSGHGPSPAGGLAVFRALLRCGFPAGPLISPALLRDPASQPQSSFIVCTPHSSIPRAFTALPRVPFLSPASGYPTPNQTTYRLGFEICTSWRKNWPCHQPSVASKQSGFSLSIKSCLMMGRGRWTERRARQKEDQKRGKWTELRTVS